jgi:hypothetical protein
MIATKKLTPKINKKLCELSLSLLTALLKVLVNSLLLFITTAAHCKRFCMSGGQCNYVLLGGVQWYLWPVIIMSYYVPACPAFINVLLWTTNKQVSWFHFFFFFFGYIEILAKVNKFLAKSVEFTTQNFDKEIGKILVIFSKFSQYWKKKKSFSFFFPSFLALPSKARRDIVFRFII